MTAGLGRQVAPGGWATGLPACGMSFSRKTPNRILTSQATTGLPKTVWRQMRVVRMMPGCSAKADTLVP